MLMKRNELHHRLPTRQEARANHAMADALMDIFGLKRV